MGAADGFHAVREPHLMDTDCDLVWVADADNVVDEMTCLPEHHSGHGFAYADLLGDGMEAVSG